MRILLIRHGDPDYENDTLTEKGCREAELLAKRALSLQMLCFSAWKSTTYGTSVFRSGWMQSRNCGMAAGVSG